MADREDNFLTRWSRRKRDPAEDPDPSAEPDQTDQGRAAVPAPQDDGEKDEEAGDAEVIAKLPDIESLDETSDFAPFLAKGVPEALRRRALRKLWRLDPVFANLDGLNDYDEDFTDAATVLSELKTAYKVGKGMVGEEPPEEAAEEATEEPAEVERAAEPQAVEPQRSESPGDTPAPEEANAAPSVDESVDEIGSDDKDRAVPVGQSMPPPGKGGEAGEAVLRKPAAPPRRNAAARRWGESSE